MWPDDEPPPLRSRGRLSSESCWCRAGFCCGRAGDSGRAAARRRRGRAALAALPGAARGTCRAGAPLACGFGGQAAAAAALGAGGVVLEVLLLLGDLGRRAEEVGWRRGGGVGRGACGACGVPDRFDRLSRICGRTCTPRTCRHCWARTSIASHRPLRRGAPRRGAGATCGTPRTGSSTEHRQTAAPTASTARRRRRRPRRRAVVDVGGGGRRRRRGRAADSRKFFRVDVRGLLRRREAAEEAALAVSEMTASQCPGRDDLLTPWEASGTRRQNNCAELRGIAQKCAELRRIARYLPFTW